MRACLFNRDGLIFTCMTNKQNVDFGNIQAALDSSAIVAITDPRGLIIYANEKFCAISGYSLEELVGQNHRIINSGHHGKEFFTQLWRQISSGEKWEGEICNRAKLGHLYWVHTVIIPFKDGDGKIQQYVSIRWDITDKKKAELGLHETKENLQSLIDATFQGLMIYDLSGQVKWLNGTAEVLLAHSNQALLNQPVEQLLGPQYGIFQTGHQTLSTDLGGKRRIFEASTKHYNFNNHTAYLVGFQDVTEKTQMESQILQQERLASVGILASGLAHEIGTPLGIMRGRAEMMGMLPGLPEPALQTSQIIIQQIDRISHLIQNLLKLARGSKTEEMQKVHLLTILSDVGDFISYEFKRSQIQFEVTVPEGLEVQAVYTSLFQVFLNLFVNAIHAIQERQKTNLEPAGSLIVSYQRQDAYHVIHVQDNGCGVAEENLSRLFTPFFTTKDVGKGTGLGLATSYRILQGWGGFMTLQSELNKGTCFSIHLPVNE